MQQIKLRNSLKKKSLTIESIRVQLFEKNQNTLSRKLATISTAQGDRIFTPSKRHLTPIFPSNELSQKTAQSIGLEKIDNSKVGRWIIREKEELRNIRRYFSMNKQFKKLSHNLSHSINLCKQEIRKTQDWGRVEGHKNIQIKKSISLKVQKIHRQKTENIERIFNPKLRRQNMYRRESFLLPLRASMDLQNKKNVLQFRSPKIIEGMEAKLLQNSIRSKFFRKNHKEKRETHISPWRVEKLKQTQAQFPN